MMDANEYRNKAMEFAKLAERQRNREFRVQLLELSAGFMQLAEATDRVARLSDENSYQSGRSSPHRPA